MRTEGKRPKSCLTFSSTPPTLNPEPTSSIRPFEEWWRPALTRSEIESLQKWAIAYSSKLNIHIGVEAVISSWRQQFISFSEAHNSSEWIWSPSTFNGVVITDFPATTSTASTAASANWTRSVTWTTGSFWLIWIPPPCHQSTTQWTTSTYLSEASSKSRSAEQHQQPRLTWVFWVRHSAASWPKISPLWREAIGFSTNSEDSPDHSPQVQASIHNSVETNDLLLLFLIQNNWLRFASPRCHALSATTTTGPSPRFDRGTSSPYIPSNLSYNGQ